MRFAYLIVLLVLAAPSRAQFRETDFTAFRDPTYPFAFHYPKSWAKVEPSNAATRFKAVSDGGAGEEDVSINVVPNPSAKGMPPGAHFEVIKSRPDLYVAALKKSAPTVRLIDRGDTTLANQPAFFVVVDYTQSAAGIDVLVRQIQYVTGKDGLNYTITMRGAPESWESQAKLFALLATRFVILPTK